MMSESSKDGTSDAPALLRESRRDFLAALAVAIVVDDARAERARVLDLGARRIRGITMVAGTPSSRAAAATPWA